MTFHRWFIIIIIMIRQHKYGLMTDCNQKINNTIKYTKNNLFTFKFHC